MLIVEKRRINKTRRRLATRPRRGASGQAEIVCGSHSLFCIFVRSFDVYSVAFSMIRRKTRLVTPRQNESGSNAIAPQRKEASNKKV